MPSTSSRRKQRGGIVVTLIVVLLLILLCGVLYLARGPILRFVGENWIVEDPLERSDAIIMLSDDNFYADRATRAAELYRRGMAPVVVASGRRLRPFAGIAELMVRDLSERGVPKDKIEAFAHDADNTREEAQALAQLGTRKKWRSVIVVTSNYHTRRARYIFDRVFPSTVKVRVASAHDGDFDPKNWWQHRKSIKQLTKEIAGLVVAIWELMGHGRASGISQSIVELMGLIPLQMV
ncbi:MAG TPA: YdcF family protein [Candidatus Acidoferrum sp.]|nr:YdcF family protein [Candidatus Acidoferrum sp.]